VPRRKQKVERPPLWMFAITFLVVMWMIGG
jgi:hypothetical protein